MNNTLAITVTSIEPMWIGVCFEFLLVSAKLVPSTLHYGPANGWNRREVNFRHTEEEQNSSERQQDVLWEYPNSKFFFESLCWKYTA